MTDPHTFHLISLGDLTILVVSFYLARVFGLACRKFLTSPWKLTIWFRHPEEIPVGSEVAVEGLAYQVTRHLWGGFVVISFTGYAARGETHGRSNRG
jgi:hypothetical protein